MKIRNACLSYENRSVFDQLDLDLPAGKWVALLGPSGVGKTSLLRTIAHLNHPHENVSVEISPANTPVAYMAQTDLLLPWLNVLNNATLGYKLRNQLTQEITNRALALLSCVGLCNIATHYPRQLSGGMRQRVALVRTLLEDQDLVLMDEPFSALDAITRFKLHELTVELLTGKTVLFITHDPLEALRLADEIYILQGSPAQLKHACSLDMKKPRSLSDPLIIHYQQALYEQLSA